MALEVIGALDRLDSDQAPGIARLALGSITLKQPPAVIRTNISTVQAGTVTISPVERPEPGPLADERIEDEPQSWTPFDGKPEPEPEPPAAAASPEAAPVDLVMAAIEAAGGWISSAEIAAATGLSQDQRSRACRALVDAGGIEASGATKNRRYRVAQPEAAPEPEPTPPEPEPAPAPEPEAVAEIEERADELDVDGRAERDAAAVETEPEPKRELKPLRPVQSQPQKPIQGPVLEAVRYRAGTIREIATRTKLTGNEVATAMLALKREGEVRSEKRGDRVVWSVS
jgi:predicted transcriptional regulator